MNCPLEECTRRDPKGLYAKALRGEIKNFTSLDDPYEEPMSSELTVGTNLLSVEECEAVRGNASACNPCSIWLLTWRIASPIEPGKF